MEHETNTRVKTEEVNEMDVPPTSTVLQDRLAVSECSTKIKREPEFTIEEDLAEMNIGAFAEEFVLDGCPLSINKEEILEDSWAFPDCIKYSKKEPEETHEESQVENKVFEDPLEISECRVNLNKEPEDDQAGTNGVPAARYAADTTSWTTDKNHSNSQRPVLQELLHDEREMGPDKLTHVHTLTTSGLRAEQTTSQDDNSYCSVDNERLTDDTVCGFTCSLCQMNFSSKYSLIMHVFIHIDGVEPPLYICRFCGNVYLTVVSLCKHFLRCAFDTVHTTKKMYKCDVCDKVFHSDSHLKRHAIVHSDVNTHKCDVCGKAFHRVGNLKQHTLIHSDSKAHKCDVCGKAFHRVGNLKQHKLIHSDGKAHKCDVCGKAFHRVSGLKNHVVIHSDVKANKCDLCGKAFHQFGNLKRHKLIHSDVKAHKCDVCGKAFHSVTFLKLHTRIHSDVKGHKCDVSDKAFPTVTDLKIIQ